jgi:hypothetical protein
MVLFHQESDRYVAHDQVQTVRQLDSQRIIPQVRNEVSTRDCIVNT